MSQRLWEVVDELDVQPDDRVLEIGVAAGKAEFVRATLEDLDLGERRFDKIFAVRVGLFHREPERARAIVEPWLAPGGSLLVVFDPPAR